MVVAIAKGVRRLMYAAFPRVNRKGLYYPRGPNGNPGVVQFCYFFFPRGEEGSLVLETTTMDQGDILARFVRGRQSEKCFTWYPGRRVKMIKKIAKNGIHLFVIFANEKEILYFDLTIKG